MKKVKKAKIFIEAALVIVVTLALLMPASAVLTNTETIKDELNISIKPILEDLKVGSCTTTKTIETTLKATPFSRTSPVLGTDIPIFNNPAYTAQNPTLANANNPNTIVAMFEFQEEIGDSNVGVINSLDGGETWSESFYNFEWGGYVELPDIDYAGNINSADLFRGASVDFDGVIHIYNIDDGADIENTLTGSSVDWSDNGFYDLTSVDIACHDEILTGEDYYIFGYIASFSGLSGYDDQVSIPHYMVDTGSGGVSCFWFYYTDSTNAKIDIDKNSEFVYYAFQYTNGTNQDVILLSSELEYVGEVEPQGWGDGMGDGRKYQIGGSANAINPAIAAENGHVYLLLQTNQGGNQDIICYYSSDDGDSYQTSVIADSGDDEMYPEIYADGENAVCIFTKDNNLYSAVTEDGGATWELGEVINDVDGSVVEQLSNADVYGDKTIWSDDRGDSTGVYFDDASVIPKPILSIEDVSGGIGVSAVITNNGDAPATDVDWSITLDGTVFLGAETTDTISSIAVGESVSIKSGFPLGFGSINIAITAQSAEGPSDTETASGKLLLFFITGL